MIVKSIQIFLLVTIALSNGQQCLEHKSSVLTPHGSLILTIPNRSGLLLVSDKMSKDEIRGETNETQKIVLINSHMAVASVGHPTYLTSFGNFVLPIKQFDANSLVKNFISSHGDFDSMTSCTAQLGQHLCRKFSSFAEPFNGSLKDGEDNDNALFLTTIHNYCRSSKKYELATITIHYNKHRKDSSVWFTASVGEYASNSAVSAFGKNEVISSIRSNDSKFEEIRNQWYSQRFICNCAVDRKASLDVSTAGACHMVKCTSEKLPSIDVRYPVGDKVDIYLLTEKEIKPLFLNQFCDAILQTEKIARANKKQLNIHLKTLARQSRSKQSTQK